MSAGTFDRGGKYQADSGRVYRCRPQVETRLLTVKGKVNRYSSSPLTPGIGSLSLTTSRRSLGIAPRTVYIRFTETPGGDVEDYEGPSSRLKVVVFLLNVFTSYEVGAPGRYLGVNCVIDSKQSETLR